MIRARPGGRRAPRQRAIDRAWPGCGLPFVWSSRVGAFGGLSNGSASGQAQSQMVYGPLTCGLAHVVACRLLQDRDWCAWAGAPRTGRDQGFRDGRAP
jgi:hypothetical protein